MDGTLRTVLQGEMLSAVYTDLKDDYRPRLVFVPCYGTEYTMPIRMGEDLKLSLVSCQRTIVYLVIDACKHPTVSLRYTMLAPVKRGELSRKPLIYVASTPAASPGS